MDYQITPIDIDLEGYADANGVHVNEQGAWLGKVNGAAVSLYVNDGNYIPAPINWRELVVSEL